MLKTKILTLILIIAFKVGYSQEEGVFVEFDAPLLLLLNPDEAALLPDIIKSTPYSEAYAALLKKADSAMTLSPDPIEKILYEGIVSGHPDRIQTVVHLQDMLSIYYLTWAYFVTKDKKYATKAIEFIMAWALVYKPSGNEVNDNKLEKVMVGYFMLQDLMTTEEKAFASAFVQKISQVQKDKWKPRGGNHYLKKLKLVYFAAYIEQDQTTIDWVQIELQKIWDMSINADGTSRDLIKRDAMHYHYSTLFHMAEIIQIGRMLGYDHYNQTADNGGSFIKSIEYTMPYVRGEKIHPEWVNTQIQLDKDRWYIDNDPYYEPGIPWVPFEAYGTLLLTSTFDTSFFSLAEKLRLEKGEPMQWLQVNSRAQLLKAILQTMD